ncbi:MAG: NmrA family NAD(P)-binding protein [Chitinivibrionales bacterium]
MNQKAVTVVGATGALGLKIVKALMDKNAHVRAMVRPTSNRTPLQDLGVTDFVVADMMNPGSLQEAMTASPKSDAIVVSAAGYTRHTKGDSPKTDTIGYRNLVDATKAKGIPRFVLISILECDKAAHVPHFYNKHLVEKYLRDKGQPFIALRAGAFLDQARDFVLPKIQKGIFPVFIPGVAYGMIYTPDLARYAAIAATSLPEKELNSTVDVGWDMPATGTNVAEAFSKVLGKKIVARPAFPSFIVNVVLPFIGLFAPGVKDMSAMAKWMGSGVYTSKNTQRQKELFDDLPSIEEAVRRYCTDRKLI